MSDVEAVRRLVADYCHLVDDRELDAWVELFADDAVVAMGRSEFRGHDAIRRWIDAVTAAGEPGRHLCVNVSVEVVGDSARSVSDFAYVERGPRLAQVGRYEDEFRRGAGGWRFTRRAIRFLPAPAGPPGFPAP